MAETVQRISFALKRLIPAFLEKGKVLVRFFAASSVTMAGNLLYGLLCVRLLPVTEYAKYVVVFGIMGMLLILMDANFTGTLMPLIGERVDNKKLVANYVASLRKLSTQAYVIVAVLAVFLFPFLIRNRGWSVPTIAGMLVSLLVCSWFARMGGNYFPVLMMRRDRDIWYKAQLISTYGTLTLLLLAWKLHLLTAFVAIWINICGYGFVAILCFVRSRRLLGVKGEPHVEKQKAIIRLALPNLPQSIFFALQGQISLFLITYFGRTSAVASIGALARLSQIFAILLQANSLLVEPYFAKLAKDKIKKHFAAAIFIAICIAAVVWSLGAVFPNILLWALGAQYSNMQHELRLALGASAVSFVSAIFWGFNSSRRFVFWWNVSFGIAMTFVVQALFIWKADVSLLTTALWMNIGTNLVSLLVNATASGWGFLRGPREVEKPIAITAEEREVLSVLEIAEIEESGVLVPPPLKITDTVVQE